MKVIALLTVTAVDRNEYGENIKMEALYKEENQVHQQFAAATPSANFSMHVTNTSLYGKFQPGMEIPITMELPDTTETTSEDRGSDEE